MVSLVEIWQQVCAFFMVAWMMLRKVYMFNLKIAIKMKTNKTRAKKLLLSFFAMLMPLLASAQTKVEINGIWYNLLSSTKQAEVTYKGSRCDEYWNEYSGSITIPATVTYGGKDYDVTSIGSTALIPRIVRPCWIACTASR